MGRKLLCPEDNRLRVYDIESGATSVLIPEDQADVNGQACLLPDGSGNFMLADDKGQPVVRPGWGIFSPTGTMLRKIAEPVSPGEAAQPEPFGPAVDAQGRMFATDVGTIEAMSTNGKLMVLFPPSYEHGCVLDTSLRFPGTIAVDDAGNVYVPETMLPGKVYRYNSPFPLRPEDCQAAPVNRSVFIEDERLKTPIGIARAANGHWYLSSVMAPPTICEYDATGRFIREIVPPELAGNPAGLTVDVDGTLFYADLGLEPHPKTGQPWPAPGKGTIRRVRFDDEGNPSPPEVILDGLLYPDAVSILPLP